jgi:ketosteroid isomerase-like protein
MSTTVDPRTVVDRWGDAERTGDVDTLRTLLTDDFAGVGPFGFQLGKDAWVDRFSSGDFHYDKFALDDVAVRRYGDAAVANGVQDQEAAYQGNPVVGRFRFTLVLVQPDDEWRVASVQLAGPIPG